MDARHDTTSAANETDDDLDAQRDGAAESLLAKENSNEKTPWYSIDTFMLPAKFSYFANGARVTISAYWLLFYTVHGLSSFQAGLINGLQYIGDIVGNPILSLIAARTGSHKYLMIFLCSMTSLVASLQIFLAHLLGNKNAGVCPAIVSNKTETLVANTDPSHQSFDSTYLFFSFLSCAIFLKFFEGSLNDLIDAAVLKRVQVSKENAKIGIQALFASIGASLGGIMYSASIHYFPTSHVSCYTGMFITFIVITMTIAVSSFPLYHKISLKTDAAERKTVDKMDVLLYLKDFDVVFLLLICLWSGISLGMVYTFILAFLKELHAPAMLLPFSIAINAFSGETVNGIADKIINLLGGSRNAMCFTCFAWSFRFLCTTLVYNPYLILVLDLFNGFTFTLSKTAALQYVKETAPRNVFTSVCGIKSILYMSIGFMIASIIGGKVYSMFGVRKLYSYMFHFSFGTGLIYFVYLVIRKLANRKK